jgi:hypothetical protein
VWILAALADLCGAGRHLIPEISESLKAQGLLDTDAEFTSVDQLLDGLERTSSRLAATVNTPPLDVAALRVEWKAIRDEARTVPLGLPSPESVVASWKQLQASSVREKRSVFEISTMVALATVTRTSQIVGAALLDHYRTTLRDIEQVGFATYAGRHMRPYVTAAVAQFSPSRRTLTERLLERWRLRNE